MAGASEAVGGGSSPASARRGRCGIGRKGRARHRTARVRPVLDPAAALGRWAAADLGWGRIRDGYPVPEYPEYRTFDPGRAGALGAVLQPIGHPSIGRYPHSEVGAMT